MNKNELNKAIVEYCEENNILGSFNNRFEDKLVSFKIAALTDKDGEGK